MIAPDGKVAIYLMKARWSESIKIFIETEIGNDEFIFVD